MNEGQARAVVKLLLDKGADECAVHEDRPTAPGAGEHQRRGRRDAAPAGRRAVDLVAVRLLLDNGANPSQALEDGSTPLMAAADLASGRTAALVNKLTWTPTQQR